MTKPPPKQTPNGHKGNTLKEILAVAAAFTHTTRVIGNDVDAARGRWTLSFDNGCELLLLSDGTLSLTCSETDRG